MSCTQSCFVDIFYSKEDCPGNGAFYDEIDFDELGVPIQQPGATIGTAGTRRLVQGLLGQLLILLCSIAYLAFRCLM